MHPALKFHLTLIPTVYSLRKILCVFFFAWDILVISNIKLLIFNYFKLTVVFNFFLLLNVMPHGCILNTTNKGPFQIF